MANLTPIRQLLERWGNEVFRSSRSGDMREVLQGKLLKDRADELAMALRSVQDSIGTAEEIERQQFIDRVAISFIAHRATIADSSDETDAVFALNAAEALWKERERRRAEGGSRA